MFMPLIKQYVKDEKKAALLNMEFKNDLGFFAAGCSRCRPEQNSTCYAQ